MYKKNTQKKMTIQNHVMHNPEKFTRIIRWSEEIAPECCPDAAAAKLLRILSNKPEPLND